MANFVLKVSDFRCHGNRGRSGINFNDTVNCLTLKTPVGATFEALFLVLPSFSHFSVKIPKFSLPWQQGSVWYKFQ